MAGDGAQVPPGAQAGRVEFFPVAIGAYRHHDALPADREAEHVAEVLSVFGAEPVPWDVQPEQRGADAVEERLGRWSRPAGAGNTFLYWVGHGSSDGDHAHLAHALSPRNTGIGPEQLYALVRERDGHARADGTWAIIVIDACRSARFAQILAARLALDPHPPRGLLIVGTSATGATNLGAFTRALHNVVTNTFRAEAEIELWDLSRELDRNLPGAEVVPRGIGGAVLRRRAPVPAGLTVPLDVLSEIEAVLSLLTADERRHFLPKAQGGELGEVAWYFEGRETERRRIAEWLRTHDSGMLVVNGAAGSGKSALLGHVLVHTRPGLRRVLADHLLIDPLPPEDLPPDDAFDLAIHLTGATVTDLVRRIAEEARLGEPPADATASRQADWLRTRLRGRTPIRGRRRLSILLDALDEAQEPEQIAKLILRPLGALPSVRLVVGTRSSTYEDPDRPARSEQNLLDALGVAAEPSADRLLTVAQDAAAVTRYVRRRLSAAADTGRLAAAGREIDEASRAIGAVNREFLFARLAVHEILARPELLSSAAADFAELLAGNHRRLFAAAVARLRSQYPLNVDLLHALALAQGRGLPIRDGVWAAAATALGSHPGQITDDDVARLIGSAAPYLMLDTEHGQSVYRLAHRTFTEHFTEFFADPSTDRFGTTPGIGAAGALGSDERHGRIVAGLTAQAEARAPAQLNSYLVAYLPAHAAAGGERAWQALADHPWVLDRLDPRILAASALRVAGQYPLPDEIGGVLRAVQQLAAAPPADRTGIRQLATARIAGATPSPRADEVLDQRAAWTVVWARRNRTPPHLVLAGHVGAVRALTPVPLPGNQVLLASAGADGTVRLWDPATGRAVGKPLTGHTGEVHTVIAITLPDGQVLLASGGADRTVRLWDPASGEAVGKPLTGHTSDVGALAAVRLPDGRTVLASGSDDPREWRITSWESRPEARDDSIRLWDPVTGRQFGKALRGHSGPVGALTSVPWADGRNLLVSGSRDGTVRLWDVASGREVGPPRRGAEHFEVTAMAVFTDAEGRAVCAVHDDYAGFELHLFDLATRISIGTMPVHWAPMHLLATFRGRGGVPLIACDQSATLYLYNPITAEKIGRLPDQRGRVTAISEIPMAADYSLLASGNEFGTIRIWYTAGSQWEEDDGDETTQSWWNAYAVPHPGGGFVIFNEDHRMHLADTSTKQRAGGTSNHDGRSSQTMPLVIEIPDGRSLVLKPRGSTVEIRDMLSGLKIGALIGHEREICGILAVPRPDGLTLIATAGQDGSVRLWDPETAEQFGSSLDGHTAGIGAMAVVPLPDGKQLLATGDRRGVIRLWDLTTVTADGTAAAYGRRMALGRRHCGAIEAMAVIPRAGNAPLLVAAGRTRDVAVWDPVVGSLVGRPYKGHSRHVWAITAVALADGRLVVATGSEDHSVHVWDPATGGRIGWPLKKHTDKVRAVTTVPDPEGSPLLVTVGDDGMVGIWDPNTGEIRATIPMDATITRLVAYEQALAIIAGNELTVIRLHSLTALQAPSSTALRAFEPPDPLESVPRVQVPGRSRMRYQVLKQAREIRTFPMAIVNILLPSEYKYRGLAPSRTIRKYKKSKMVREIQIFWSSLVVSSRIHLGTQWHSFLAVSLLVRFLSNRFDHFWYTNKKWKHGKPSE